MPSIHELGLTEFEKRVPLLKSRMIAALDKEMSDGDLPEGPGCDVFSGLPTVDSKTVCKMSPTVKDVLGCSLKPRWVKKGGYGSVQKAVEDVIQNIRNEIIEGPKKKSSTISLAA
jgi:hypothetical protein